MSARGSVRVERGAKRVRAYLGGELVADTIAPLLVWEAPYYPAYYFPRQDVRAELLDEGGAAEPLAEPRRRGDTTVVVGRAARPRPRHRSTRTHR